MTPESAADIIRRRQRERDVRQQQLEGEERRREATRQREYDEEARRVKDIAERFGLSGSIKRMKLEMAIPGELQTSILCESNIPVGISYRLEWGAAVQWVLRWESSAKAYVQYQSHKHGDAYSINITLDIDDDCVSISAADGEYDGGILKLSDGNFDRKFEEALADAYDNCHYYVEDSNKGSRGMYD